MALVVDIIQKAGVQRRMELLFQPLSLDGTERVVSVCT